MFSNDPAPNAIDVLATLSIEALTEVLQDPNTDLNTLLRAAGMALRHVNAERNRAERIAARQARASSRVSHADSAALDDDHQDCDTEAAGAVAQIVREDSETDAHPGEHPEGSSFDSHCEACRADSLLGEPACPCRPLQDDRPP